MGMEYRCFVCGRVHDGEELTCGADDKLHRLVRMVANLDGVLTGLSRPFIKYNLESKGVKGLINGERFYMSDGRSYIQFLCDELVLVTDLDFVKARCEDVRDDIFKHLQEFIGELIYGAKESSSSNNGRATQ